MSDQQAGQAGAEFTWLDVQTEEIQGYASETESSSHASPDNATFWVEPEHGEDDEGEGEQAVSALNEQELTGLRTEWFQEWTQLRKRVKVIANITEPGELLDQATSLLNDQEQLELAATPQMVLTSEASKREKFNLFVAHSLIDQFGIDDKPLLNLLGDKETIPSFEWEDLESEAECLLDRVHERGDFNNQVFWQNFFHETLTIIRDWTDETP